MQLFLTLLACILFGHSFAETPTFSVVETITLPDGWIQCGPAEASALLKLRLAIDLPDQSSLFGKRLIDAATPGHPLYGKHLTRDQANDYLLPAPQVSAALCDWITKAGIPPEQYRNDGGNWITFTATVAQAEAILNAQYYYFINGGRTEIRTLQYSVPEYLRQCISMVQPTTRFGQARPQTNSLVESKVLGPNATFQVNASDCGTYVTPSCLNNLYHLVPLGARDAPWNHGNRFGISGFLEEYAQYDDWFAFAAKFDTASWMSNFTVRSINGGLNTQHDRLLDSQEANLDIQYGRSTARGVKVIYYSTAGRGQYVQDLDQTIINNQTTNEPYLEELLYLLALPDDQLPYVLSTSYGENEQSVPRSYALNVCFLYAQLGARGVSVIFSSGDSGVGKSCLSNDGMNTTRFTPIFPASCPFVTSVGGTTGQNPERAVWFSSGGFSNIWPRPAWQEKAVEEYLNSSIITHPFTALYNQTGRGFPDVSAQAVDYLIIDKGEVISVSGTSAAAPVFAAIITNINSILLSNGNAPLGFLNPFLYSSGMRGLQDIVDGGSTGCHGYTTGGKKGAYVAGAGFNATSGWDPVSGLGTPFYPYLLDAACEQSQKKCA